MRCSRIPDRGAELGPGSGTATPTDCLAGPPISVVSLLRREGRGPHTVGRPLAPRGHSREAAPPPRRSARKAAAAAGALFAVGALIAPAVLHDALVLPRADAGSPSTHGGMVDAVNAPSDTGMSRSPGIGPMGLALAAMVHTMSADPPQVAPDLPGPATAGVRPSVIRATPDPVFGAPATAVPPPGKSGADKPGNGPPAKDNADGKPGNGPPPKDKNADGKPGNGPPAKDNADGKPGNGPPPMDKNADTLPANGSQAGGKGRGNEQAKGRHAKDERADGKPGNRPRGTNPPGQDRKVPPPR